MQEATVSLLAVWGNFYVIVGTAAATLTGLMFVVITLTMGAQVRKSSETIGAFGTPTVVHFGAALLVAAIISAPWQELWQVGFLIGLFALAGVVYIMIIIRRTRRQELYKPVLEDWLWHIIFPLISYTTILIATILFAIIPVFALFGVGAATVLFLFIGIHNAWDTVTFVAIDRAPPEGKSQEV